MQLLHKEKKAADTFPPLNKSEVQRHRLINLLQTSMFLTVILALLSFIAYLVFGGAGLWLCFWFVVLFCMCGVQISPQVVLSLHKAKPIPIANAPHLHELTAVLAKQASLSKAVSLYSTPGRALNAFSTGTRHHPCIVLSEGLLGVLSSRELAGVVAHEMAHLANGDLKIMVLSHLIGKAVSFFALLGQILVWLNLPFILNGELSIPLWFFLLIGFGPTLMQLIHLKLSRVREYQADMIAINLTQDPHGLSSALRKIGHAHNSLLQKVLASSVEASEPPEWLSTHPPTARRIKKIESTLLLETFSCDDKRSSYRER